MKTQLTDEARELGEVVERAVRKHGGVDIARAAERGDPSTVHDVLERLGLWELRPHKSVEDGEAAAATCRAVGRVALPYPVAERLAARPEDGYDAIAVVGRIPRINLISMDSALRWAVSDGAYRIAPVVGADKQLGSKLGSLVSPVTIGEWASSDVAPLALTLSCWTLLGMLDSALEMTRQHLLTRTQFGKPLASFQALQFRLADTVTALQGFEELAKYTLWSVLSRRPGALVDALGCRLVAIDVADTLFRTGHQMHGAMGFCDEVDLSWLSRHSQPVRRLPWGRSQTQARLLDAMQELPFDGLFGQGLVSPSVLAL